MKWGNDWKFLYCGNWEIRKKMEGMLCLILKRIKKGECGENSGELNWVVS